MLNFSEIFDSFPTDWLGDEVWVHICSMHKPADSKHTAIEWATVIQYSCNSETPSARTCIHTCKCALMNASVPDQSARQRAVSWGIVGGWRIIGETGFVGLMPHSCFGQSWDQRKECLITMPKRDSIMPNFLWVSKTLGIAE